jgi:hypothetical protein
MPHRHVVRPIGLGTAGWLQPSQVTRLPKAITATLVPFLVR